MSHLNHQTQIVKTLIAAILSAAVGLGIATPLQAETSSLAGDETAGSLPLHDDAPSLRINMSGKLRMLSQKISSLSCVLAHSDNAELLATKLSDANAEFDRIMLALRDGDKDLGIPGAEENRKILLALDGLAALWAPFHTASQALLVDKTNKDAEMFIAENNMKLLGLAKLAVSEISGKYANPVEVTGSEAMLIDFSGRQRMLTQKIAKEGCGVVFGVAGFGTMDDMSKTISTFEATHMALSNGMPSAGIAAPPNGEIRLGLEQAGSQWQEIKQISDAIVGVGSIEGDVLGNLVVLLDAELKQMNKVTGLYSAYAKVTK